ncbi:TepA modulator TepJ [Bacillus subtilis]|uniref:TepA modulator TepJ n=1 Tax=Bacillus subtilis TaxID=1423 RepID=UPI0030003558
MILYTVMPQEIVFAEQNQETSAHEQIEYKGVPLLVEMKGNEAEVIQIMSTNPLHFLHPDIAPGQKLKLNV